MDLRNLRHAEVALGSGLNVFVGRNAQGKTSLLEGAGLLARGRSFRAEDSRMAIRKGAERLLARGAVSVGAGREPALEVEIGAETRRFRVDGREVPPREYQGRLEVVVYSTERLRVVRGPMRERRQFLDRGASALWPSYRQQLREFERVLLQRNAALERRAPDLPVWTERFIVVAADLRRRRGDYARRLTEALKRGFRPEGETYAVETIVQPEDQEAARMELARALQMARAAEMAAGRSLLGPHRDGVVLLVNGQEAAETASAGQARSLLLALVLAALEIYREERGEAAVALLDDLDSELDEARAREVCREVGSRGQALVTTAHPGWAERLAGEKRLHHVEAGEVRSA